MSLIHQKNHDEIASHAKPLIEFLEEKIKKDFGYDVQMGFEKELFIRFWDSGGTYALADHYNSELFKLGGKIPQLGATEHFQKKQKGGYSPVEFFHAEQALRQFEFKTLPASPARAVERIDAQVNRVQAFTQEYLEKINHDHVRNSDKSAKESIDKFASKHSIREIDFEPYVRGTSECGAPITSGLHVNMSLWSDNKNITDNAGNRKKVKAIMKALRVFSEHDLLMIAPSYPCYTRLNVRADVTGDDSVELHTDEKKPMEDRIELRTPSSLARHDLSALFALSAIYEGLQHPDMKLPADFRALSKSQKGFETASKMFKENSKVMGCLGKAAEGNDEMMKHVSALKAAIISAARKRELEQPEVGHWLKKTRTDPLDSSLILR